MLRKPLFCIAMLLVLAGAVLAQDVPLRTDCGGWTPPPELLRKASALAGLKAKALKAALERLDREGPGARIAVCRAGLRLRDDRAAHDCAVHLEWDQLDSWEHERVIALCLKDYARPGTLVDFEKLRSMIGSIDLDHVFSTFPPPPRKKTATYYLANLHRQIRADHVPVLCAMVFSGDREVVENTWDNLGLVLCRTNQHLDLAARTLLKSRDLSAGKVKPPGSGLPVSLAAVMRGLWKLPKEEPEGWEARWLLASKPGKGDAALILDLAGRYRKRTEFVFQALVRSMRHLEDEVSRDFLREVADKDPCEETRLLARGALAARGEAQAMNALEKAWETDELALALGLEADPGRSKAGFCFRVLHGPSSPARKALDRLIETDESVSLYQIHWPENLFDGFEALALDQIEGDGFRLGHIALAVPGCRTRTLARAICNRLTPASLLAEVQRGKQEDVSLDALFSFLETAAPGPFRGVLRTWAEHLDRTVRTLGLYTLLRIGDAQSGERLVRWIASGQAMADLEEVQDLVQSCSEAGIPDLLARSPCPAVEAHLRKENNEMALAIFHGLPEETAFALFPDMGEAPASGEALRRELIQAGRARDALHDLLARAPDKTIPFLWKVDTPRVRAHLKGLQKNREAELYAWATAQLACMGDEKARAETWAVLRAGRYRWMDEVCGDKDLATFGYDFKATLPFWIRESESNCCRRVIALGVFNELFGLEPELDDRGNYEIPADRVGRWWKRYQNARLVWSHLAGHFQPVL